MPYEYLSVLTIACISQRSSSISERASLSENCRFPLSSAYPLDVVHSSVLKAIGSSWVILTLVTGLCSNGGPQIADFK